MTSSRTDMSKPYRADKAIDEAAYIPERIDMQWPKEQAELTAWRDPNTRPSSHTLRSPNSREDVANYKVKLTADPVAQLDRAADF
jgi:hypothetical protein